MDRSGNPTGDGRSGQVAAATGRPAPRAARRAPTAIRAVPPAAPGARRRMPAALRRPRRRPAGTAPARARAQVPPALALAAAWSWRLLAVGAAVWFAVTWISGLTVVWVPIVLSLLLAALLKRPTLWLRRRLPRWLAALLVLLGALLVIAGVGYLISRRVAGQSQALVNQAQDVLSRLQDRVSSLPAIGAGGGSVVQRISSYVQAHRSTIVSGAFTAGTYAVEFVTGLVLTFFLTLFLLMDGDRMWAWLVRLLPRRAQPSTNGAGHAAFRVLSGWITGTAIIALIHGVVIGLTLWLLGTPLTVVLAVLVFIGSFIPIIGAFVFGGFAVLVTLVTQGLLAAAILLGVLILENLLEGHVYQPLIMGRTVRLHPVAILLGLAVGGLLAGIMGAIIAIPLIGALHAAVKYLTGIEDIDGNSLREEDRMEPEPPPVVVRGRRQPTR
jgi:predicted PurR-regulated permease PerM